MHADQDAIGFNFLANSQSLSKTSKLPFLCICLEAYIQKILFQDLLLYWSLVLDRELVCPYIWITSNAMEMKTHCLAAPQMLLELMTALTVKMLESAAHYVRVISSLFAYVATN